MDWASGQDDTTQHLNLSRIVIYEHETLSGQIEDILIKEICWFLCS
jgi:hypothetical protein